MYSSSATRVDAAFIEDAGRRRCMGLVGCVGVAAKSANRGARCGSRNSLSCRKQVVAGGIEVHRGLRLARKARSNNGNANLVAQGIVDDLAVDDIGIFVDNGFHSARCSVDFGERKVAAAGDGEQNAACALDGSLEQVGVDGLRRSVEGTILRPCQSQCPSWPCQRPS